MQSVKKWAPLLALALVAMNGATLQAETPYVYQPVPRADFTAVSATAPRTHPYIGLWTDEAQPEPAPFATPESTPSAQPKPPPRTAQPALSSTGSSEGTATFYCNHDASRGRLSRCSRGFAGGLYAAISPDLLWLRGSPVQVCYEASCVNVTVIDCNCGPGVTKAIDLYADAFVRLAPLSRGRIPVTISW